MTTPEFPSIARQRKIFLEKGLLSPKAQEENAERLTAQIGLNWHALTDAFKEKFLEMNQWGHQEDSIRMNEIATEMMEDPEVKKLFEYKPATVLETLRYVMQGNTISDIGKRGPEGATKEQSELITEIFKVRNMEEKPEEITVTKFVLKYLKELVTSKGKEKILDNLSACGVIPNMTMREFYNLHTKWSLEILNKEPMINSKVKTIVARHHTLDGVRILAGELTLEDKIVILLDQYDAFRNRGGKTHEDTIKLIREKIEKIGFNNDQDFKSLLSVLDKVTERNSIYDKVVNINVA